MARTSTKKGTSGGMWQARRSRPAGSLSSQGPLKATSPRPALAVCTMGPSAGSPRAQPPYPPASRMACSGATCKGAYSLVRKEPLSKITSNLNAPSCRWREERASRAPLTSHSEVRNVTGESKEDTEPKRTPRVWWATWIFISSLGAPGKWGAWSSYCSRGDRAERLPVTVNPTSDGRAHHWGGHSAGHGERG